LSRKTAREQGTEKDLTMVQARHLTGVAPELSPERMIPFQERDFKDF